MGIFDWFKKLGKTAPDEGDADLSSEKKPAKKSRRKKKADRATQTASSAPNVPGWRRRLMPDARYLAKPAKKNWWEPNDPVLDRDEARRAFSPGMRTRNRALRSLGTDDELLQERGLPRWDDEMAVAAALGITVQKLWWLASHRYDDRTTHYVRFRVPKRSGGYRTIMAPKRELKAQQRRLLELLVNRLAVSEYAHGFVSGRSVATNAAPHVGKRVVIRFDLENFFGTVTFGRVRGFLLALGYNYEVATSLTLLMTESDRQPVDLGNDVRHVPVGHRYCVQGAPTSPGLCNAITMKLDHRLAGLARANGYTYTRYADDMTFSGDDESKIGRLLRMVGEIVEAEGFSLNSKKTAVMRSGRGQRVTGVTVNETLGLSRKERRRLRARIHQMNPQSSAAEIARLRGELAYLQMLNPAQAEALRPEWLTGGIDER